MELLETTRKELLESNERLSQISGGKTYQEKLESLEKTLYELHAGLAEQRSALSKEREGAREREQESTRHPINVVLTHQVESLSRDVQSLQSQISSREESFTSLQKEKDQLTQEHSDLQNSKREADEALKALRGEVNERDSRVIEMESVLARIQLKAEQETQQARKHSEDFEVVQQQNRDLMERIAHFEATERVRENELQSLRAEVESRHEAQLNERALELTAERQRTECLLSRNSALEEELAASREKIIGYEQNIVEAENTNAILQLQLEALGEELAKEASNTRSILEENRLREERMSLAPYTITPFEKETLERAASELAQALGITIEPTGAPQHFLLIADRFRSLTLELAEERAAKIAVTSECDRLVMDVQELKLRIDEMKPSLNTDVRMETDKELMQLVMENQSLRSDITSLEERHALELADLSKWRDEAMSTKRLLLLATEESQVSKLEIERLGQKVDQLSAKLLDIEQDNAGNFYAYNALSETALRKNGDAHFEVNLLRPKLQTVEQERSGTTHIAFVLTD